MDKLVDERENITEASLREELGSYVAPVGLFTKNRKIPFLGRVACSTESLVAGEWTEIKLVYEVGEVGLADGAWIKATFKFYSDWALFQTTDPKAPNFVSAEYKAAPLVEGQSPATVQSLKVRFDQKGHERPFQKAVIVDTVDGYLNPGDQIIIRMGDRRQGGPGTRVQTFVEENFRFRCYVDPLGSSRFAPVPGDVSFDIVAGEPSKVEIRGSRMAKPGEPLSLNVRVDDIWGNACVDLDARVLVQAFRDGEEVYSSHHTFNKEGRQKTDHWAFVKITDLPLEKGELHVRASMPEWPGVESGEFYVTIDDDCPVPRVLFAELHCHAEDTVGINDADYNIRYGRDCMALDVMTYTANDFQINERDWQSSEHFVQELNEPGTFVVYPNQEWCGSSAAGGDHCVIFLQDEDPQFPKRPDGHGNARSFEWNEKMSGEAVKPGAWPLELLWRTYMHDPENHLIMPHVGGRRCILDWYHPELERLLEVCSAWGHFDWLYKDAMARGHKFGAYGSGDEHRGRPGGGAPGTQVFGVHGGVTAVFADGIDRKSVGKALRARHTCAVTGKRTFGIVRCGDYMQGDEFTHNGPATLDYRFVGDAGWDEISAWDHTGCIYSRNLHEESGYSDRRIRIRWGGARVKDRYRWCEWKGTVSITNGTINDFKGMGFEHIEESCWRTGTTDVGFRSDTYGDADGVELWVDGLANCRIRVKGTIDGYIKVGNPLAGNPFAHCPEFDWEISGQELLESNGVIRKELGGAEMFLSIERLTDGDVPRDVQGSLEIDPQNGPHGHRPVYFLGRETDDGKVWTSAVFITFN